MTFYYARLNVKQQNFGHICWQIAWLQLARKTNTSLVT